MTKMINVLTLLRRFFEALGAERARTAPRLANALRDMGR